MPGILLAQTDAPTPLPQIATPRSTFSALQRPGERDDEIGIVVVLVQAMSAEIDDLMPRRAELGDEFLLQAKSAMIGGNSYAHTSLLSLHLN